MTCLSRDTVRRPSQTAENRGVTHPLSLWHVPCFLLGMSGCFYLGPIPTIEENLPPEYTTNPIDGSQVAIPPEGKWFLVLASDPEGEEVAITWVLEGQYLGTALPVPYEYGQGSQLFLSADETYEGKILTCYLDDGHGRVTLEWDLEVL